jgi:hypothetical protein
MLAVRSSPSVDWPFEVTIGSGPKEGQRGTELRRSRRMTGSRYKMATCAPGANFSALTGPTDIFRPVPARAVVVDFGGSRLGEPAR